MSRSVSLKVGSKSIKLVASFNAASDICDEVHDLLGLYNDQQRALLYFQLGRTYQPNFVWTVKAVGDVVAIGVRHSGSDLSRDEIDAALLGMGLDKAQVLAQDYLALFFAEPEERSDAENGAGGEKK